MGYGVQLGGFTAIRNNRSNQQLFKSEAVPRWTMPSYRQSERPHLEACVTKWGGPKTSVNAEAMLVPTFHFHFAKEAAKLRTRFEYHSLVILNTWCTISICCIRLTLASIFVVNMKFTFSFSLDLRDFIVNLKDTRIVSPIDNECSGTRICKRLRKPRQSYN
jgi:hypothetical protein